MGAGRPRAQRAGRGPRPDRAQSGPAHARGPICTPPPATCSGSWTPTAWCWPRRCCRPACSVTGSAARRCWCPALVLFGAASLACAYSHSSGELIAARAVLGLGAAVILPLSLAVIPVLFTPEERQKAIAVVMAAVFIGYPLGPILGGWLLDNYWWGSVFLINVPVIAIALIAVALLMPESRSEQRPRLDATGRGHLQPRPDRAGLRLHQGGRGRLGRRDRACHHGSRGRGAGRVHALGAAGTRRAGRAAAGRAVAVRVAGFTWGTILATLVSFALFGILFAMPLYFRDVRGLDSLGAGLRLLPMIGGMVVGMVAGTRLQSPAKTRRRHAAARPASVGAKALVAGGFAMMAVALAAGAFTSVSSGTGYGAAWFAVAGRRARPGHAVGHERGSRRAVGRAQRRGLGRDHGVSPGRRDAGGGDPGHRAQLRLPGPAGPGRAARRGGGRRALRHLRRRRGRPHAGLGFAAAHRRRRVRSWPGRDAVVLRGDRAGRGPAGAGLPAAPRGSAGRGERGGRRRPVPAASRHRRRSPAGAPVMASDPARTQ